MEPARKLRQRIDRRDIVTGVLVTFHLWPGLMEVCRNAGLDYAIIDLEHGAFPDDVVAQTCDIGRLLGFPVLIRPVDRDYGRLRRLADLGPAGFLLPTVEHPSELDEVAQAIHMPPRGRRRPGGGAVAWLADVQYETWKRDVEDDFLILPQIESRVGMVAADAIARHPLTTALAIGPYDLSAELGCCWRPDEPAFVEAIDGLRRTADQAGKACWMIGDGAALRDRGFTLLCIGEPVAALQAALSEANTLARGGTTDSGKPADDRDAPPPA